MSVMERVVTVDLIRRADGAVLDEGLVVASDSEYGTRPLEPGELLVACAHCGQRFAATGPRTATENRDRHIQGDADEDHAPNCREAVGR